MPEIKKQADAIDWNLTTWDGSRREQLRRWAALSLEEILLAQEEMREVAGSLAQDQSAVNKRKPSSAAD